MSNVTHTYFGQWLKQRRREAGITRDDLAEQAACSSETLQKMENGQRRPSRQIALSLAELFHVPVDEQEAFVTFARARPSTRVSLDDTPGARDATAVAGHIAVEATVSRTANVNSSQGSPWRAAHLRQSNLPDALSSFIGRDEEEAAIQTLLLQPKVRLLTLVGTPGIGKTRLSLEVAGRAEMAEHFADGVFLVELAPITNPSLVVLTIARALGLKEPGGTRETLAALLLQYVQDKRMLLVLDNFEQVLDAAPDVMELLTKSPWLKVLVTSREALHVRRERRFQVPPLQLPLMTCPFDLETLTHNPAVTLFVERAQEMQPDFELTQENVKDVAAVCEGLDGLPLAIELAASRTGMLSVKQMREALSSRLKLSSRGTRDLPARLKTLRAAIDWSYDLLDNGEKHLFRRMGVFVGGCTLESIRRVCAVDGTLVDAAEGVESLLSKSLLQQREGADGEPRFWMLEMIHEYAKEKLEESGESHELKGKHILFFLEFAERAEPEFRGSAQDLWLKRSQLELDNLRAALQWGSVRTQSAQSPCHPLSVLTMAQPPF